MWSVEFVSKNKIKKKKKKKKKKELVTRCYAADDLPLPAVCRYFTSLVASRTLPSHSVPWCGLVWLGFFAFLSLVAGAALER